MKEIWKNEWFKLGAMVVLFFITAASPAWGATVLFAYFVAWMVNKQNSKQL